MPSRHRGSFIYLHPDKYNRLTVQTERGCPWQCDFCSSSTALTTRYNVKPVSKVMDEIRAIKQIWSKPFVEFADDNTFVNKKHSKLLMRALANENVRWFTETDVSVAGDPELLSLMRQAGCVQILVGLESPNATALDGVELGLSAATACASAQSAPTPTPAGPKAFSSDSLDPWIEIDRRAYQHNALSIPYQRVSMLD